MINNLYDLMKQLAYDRTYVSKDGNRYRLYRPSERQAAGESVQVPEDVVKLALKHDWLCVLGPNTLQTTEQGKRAAAAVRFDLELPGVILPKPDDTALPPYCLGCARPIQSLKVIYPQPVLSLSFNMVDQTYEVGGLGLPARSPDYSCGHCGKTVDVYSWTRAKWFSHAMLADVPATLQQLFEQHSKEQEE